MKNIKKSSYNYEYIVGKTKKQIINELGHGFNYYPADTWNYEINKNWWGLRTILIIKFQDGISVQSKIKKKYGK